MLERVLEQKGQELDDGELGVGLKATEVTGDEGTQKLGEFVHIPDNKKTGFSKYIFFSIKSRDLTYVSSRASSRKRLLESSASWTTDWRRWKVLVNI